MRRYYAGPVTPIEQRFPRPSLMGVVNVTPDSFSDGGVNLDPGDAVATARRMLDEGAAIVDVGGESTRPGSEGVSADEELRGDPRMAEVVAESGAYVCLMHMQGEPRTMQVDPKYDDVVSEVASFLEERLRFAVDHGVAEDRVCLDPGIGFGKNVEHNFELLRRLDVIVRIGRPVVVGFSRKRSLGRLLGDPDATTGSLSASLAGAVADALLARFGAERVRVRGRKPEVRLDPPVEWSAATVERSRS